MFFSLTHHADLTFVSVAVVKKLLLKGANPSLTFDDDGHDQSPSPLTLAVESDIPECVEVSGHCVEHSETFLHVNLRLL